MSMPIKPLSMVVGEEFGYFYEGTLPETVVFVPEYCVAKNGDEFSIDDTKFYLSGWAAKSARFSGADFEFVFPAHNKPMAHEKDSRLKALLIRLRHAYALSSTSVDL